MILAGDVGGTKIHLARYEVLDERLVRREETRVPTQETESLPTLLREWTKASGGVQAAALGIAGPVLDDTVDGTNLPWVIRAGDVSAALGGVPVRLLNDLEASAHGLQALGPEDLETLQAGEVHRGNRALVSPGTGLGECLLLRDGDRYLPVGSEGGHADFAPRTDEEMDLLRYLRPIWGRVSVERVVSGPGLVNVFCWLRDTGCVADDSGIAAGPGDSAPAGRISQAALEGRSKIAAEALRVWVSAFGSHAANTALRGYAVGGVFLGGGIPLRVLPALREPGFLEAFWRKSPHESMLRRVPVHVVKDPDTALAGAGWVASQLGE